MNKGGNRYSRVNIASGRDINATLYVTHCDGPLNLPLPYPAWELGSVLPIGIFRNRRLVHVLWLYAGHHKEEMTRWKLQSVQWREDWIEPILENYKIPRKGPAFTCLVMTGREPRIGSQTVFRVYIYIKGKARGINKTSRDSHEHGPNPKAKIMKLRPCKQLPKLVKLQKIYSMMSCLMNVD